VLSAAEPARLLLLGGEPFGEPVLMWWNCVVRSRDELGSAYRQWESGHPRFGRLRSPPGPHPGPAAVLAADHPASVPATPSAPP